MKLQVQRERLPPLVWLGSRPQMPATARVAASVHAVGGGGNMPLNQGACTAIISIINLE